MSDPSRPGQPLDIVTAGDERDPWRPGRTTWALVAVLVLAAAITVPIRAHQRHVDRLRALDDAAAAAVALAPTSDPRLSGVDDTRDTVGIGLRNDSDLPVTVLGYQVLGEGYRAQKVNLSLKGNELIGFDVADTATCSTKLLNSDTMAQEMRLTVRTARGQVVTKDEPLVDTAGAALSSVARTRCALYSTLEAFIPQVLDAGTVSHRRLTTTVALHNAGRLPLTLTSVQSYPGTTVTMSRHAPLAIPYDPKALESPSGGLEVEFSVTLSDCTKALGASPTFADPNLDVPGPGSVVVHLTGATGPVVTTLQLEPDPGRLLSSACP
jgi:hypothetical protein